MGKTYKDIKDKRKVEKEKNRQLDKKRKDEQKTKWWNERDKE